jgi:hypothetical protein
MTIAVVVVARTFVTDAMSNRVAVVDSGEAAS